MKKLLLLLATFSLSAGAFASWNNVSQQATHDQNLTTSDSGAQDIANKLSGHTVKLDPNFWLHQSIQVYVDKLQATIVQEGILTQAEARDVIWQPLTIDKAVHYPNVTFTVIDHFSVAHGQTELDASTGESSYQIAQKIQAFPEINLEYSYWHTHPLKDHIPELQKVLVDQKVLTAPEASVVTGVKSTTPHPVPGPFHQGVIVNDDVTESVGTAFFDYI